jgi:hypothetical protein
VCFSPDGVGVDPVWIGRVDEPQRLTLGDLIRTALVHRRLPGAVAGTMAPLSPSDVGWARDHLIEEGGVTRDVRDDFAGCCDAAGVGDHAEALAEILLPRLAVELAAVEIDDEATPDLSKLGGLLTIQSIGMWLKTTRGVD